MCKGLKLGSKSNRCGSKLTGDCLRPLLHKCHSGFIKPQNAGPLVKENEKLDKEENLYGLEYIIKNMNTVNRFRFNNVAKFYCI